MSSEQLEVNDRIMARFGRLAGPFAALLHSPRLADLSNQLATYLLDEELNVPRRASELAILVTGRHWSCHYEFHRHQLRALESGIDQAAIDALSTGRHPVLEPELDDVYQFAKQLLEDGDVTDDVFTAITDRWGTQGAIDLTVVVGVYCMIAFVLNVDRVSPPEDEDGRLLPPLPRPTRAPTA